MIYFTVCISDLNVQRKKSNKYTARVWDSCGSTRIKINVRKLFKKRKIAPISRFSASFIKTRDNLTHWRYLVPITIQLCNTWNMTWSLFTTHHDIRLTTKAGKQNRKQELCMHTTPRWKRARLTNSKCRTVKFCWCRYLTPLLISQRLRFNQETSSVINNSKLLYGLYRFNHLKCRVRFCEMSLKIRRRRFSTI